VSAIASLNLSFIISEVCSWFHPGFKAPTRDDKVVETWYLRQGIHMEKSGRWRWVKIRKKGREGDSDGRKG
jgi:hypothetical protein